jgi:hypothetical protein
VETNSLQRPPQCSVRNVGEAYQAQLLAARHKRVEASGKVAAGFDYPQPQLGNEGRAELEGHGMSTLPQRPLELEPRLDPLPPVFDLPAFFVQPRHTAGRQVKAISQPEHPAVVWQLRADPAQFYGGPARQATGTKRSANCVKSEGKSQSPIRSTMAWECPRLTKRRRLRWPSRGSAQWRS